MILRKGGIHEKGKRFEVAHDEFFLFPTFEHQHPKDLKPVAEPLLRRVLEKKPPPGVLPIQYYCTVEGSFWIRDLDTLKALDPYHFWSWECVKARFEWGEEQGLFGIVVRSHTLPEPVLLENLKRYGGCRSWVELEATLETASLRPVLPDPLFKEKREKILEVPSLA